MITYTIHPTIAPTKNSIIQPVNADQSTSLTPSTAVLPFTVAIIPKIATKAFVRKNNSRRNSSSGNNHLTNHLPTGITTKTNRPNSQAINLNETPGKENIAWVKPKNRTGNIKTPGNQYNTRYAHIIRLLTGEKFAT